MPRERQRGSCKEGEQDGPLAAMLAALKRD